MSTPLLQEFNLPSIKLHTRLHTFWRMVTLHGNGQVRMEWLLRIFLDSHTLGKLKKLAAIIDYFNSNFTLMQILFMIGRWGGG